eukprot:superscaffoldBa00001579_g11164
MESQLDRARESQRQQIQQADMALEQFKKQVELSSEKAYADMKLQMEKVEEDLIRSKSLRENQAKEFSQQLDALRQKYEQQTQRSKIGLRIEQAAGIEAVDLRSSGRPGRVPSSTMCRGLASKQGGEWAPGPCCPFKAPAGAARLDGVGVTGPPAMGEWEPNRAWERLGGSGLGTPLARLTSQQMAEQRMQYEQERTRLQQQHSAEKDSLVQERQREVSSVERQARAALQQHQQHTQEWRKRDAQTISDLEAQLSCLREELQVAHVQHKQQLAEMALLREEEKQKAFLDKEASLDRLRSDMERIRSDLERSHQQERDAAQEKAYLSSPFPQRTIGPSGIKRVTAIGPLGTSEPPLRVLAQEDRPVSLVMALCFRGDRCVRSERTAVFVRKCLDGVQSPNAAQVLIAARANWQQGFNSPPPPLLLSDELLAGDQRGVVPTVHHAHHYLLAHMNVGAGTLPRGHRPATHCQEAEVNASVCVCVITNSRLKQIEKEYSQKLAKSAQLIAELQTSVCDSKEEAVRLQQALERQLEEANTRWDKERRTITHHADQANKWAIGGSVSPADIVSMLLTSKGSDYEESEGLQTMGGEENNIKLTAAERDRDGKIENREFQFAAITVSSHFSSESTLGKVLKNIKVLKARRKTLYCSSKRSRQQPTAIHSTTCLACSTQPPFQAPAEDFTTGLFAQPQGRLCPYVVVPKIAPIFNYVHSVGHCLPSERDRVMASFLDCFYADAAQALQEKVESLQRHLHCSEKTLLSKELETEEKLTEAVWLSSQVTVVRQEYEERIKGLMPAELRQELEDTITSLKAQVTQ